jgi:hypothetical protein
MALDADMAEAVLAQLDAVYAASQAQIRKGLHFGNAQDATLGALRIAYDTTAKALIETETDAVSGNYDSDRWVQLAIDAENDMRSISGYAGGTTVSALLTSEKEAFKEAADKVPAIAAGAGILLAPILLPIVVILVLVVIIKSE